MEINYAMTESVMQPIIRKKHLSVEGLKTLSFPMKIQGNQVIIEKSVRNRKLRHVVILNLNKVLAAKEKGLVNYILSSLVSERPALLSFVFDNQSLVKMARHFLRHCSGSLESCYTYTANVQKYAVWLGCSPDMIIADVKPVGSIPDPARVQNHIGFVNDYLAWLQDEGLKAGSVVNCIKSVKTFYRVNGVKVELSERLSRRVVYKDRSPTAEELVKVLDVADLRQKVIVSLLALGGFREGTLSKLKYRHVREDIEKNISPLHVDVPIELTKGKYEAYSTFVGAEAEYYLRLYLDDRRKGNSRRKPEDLTDDSPLIRDEHKVEPQGITPKQIRRIVHGLYVKAGIVQHFEGHYDVRAHSLRKYFKTQLLALGVQPDYVDYWMGHKLNTYHDIDSVGLEKLRSVYSAAGLSIRPKTHVNKIEALKEMIRAMGMNPEAVLTRDALVQGATTTQNGEDRQILVLRQQLKELILAKASV
jgi:site-specific recombinase XerD